MLSVSATCRRKLCSRRMCHLPDGVEVLLGGCLLVALSLKIGQGSTDPSLFRYLNWPMRASDAFRGGEHQRTVEQVLLGLYALSFALHFLPLPSWSWFTRGRSVLSRLLHESLLIPMMHFIMLGFNCVKTPGSDADAGADMVLSMDLNTHCDEASV